ncbi:carboxylesterase family protein [Vibrio splendidus]|uniref:carboxylesterase family protein n=1 Tax=Vibrio splendidus TaxID=29497 RepID=UPI0022361518|nr:carboxylesterase family protein [Vibrio splendidus]MCW4446531.1 carboxylesterase family protein [Vibrio splendidus]
MKIKIITLFALSSLLIGCNSDDNAAISKSNFQGVTTVETEYGTIQGTDDLNGEVLSWLGVRYAQPPIGDLRWQAPKEPKPFNELRETKQFKDGALRYPVGGKNLVGSEEDSLYLNIWRPNTEEINLPVLLFVHGGGNTGGSAQEFIGNKLALSTNSVIISIDYRLGVLAWFRHPLLNNNDNKLNESGNFGLLDIIESLKWTSKNISHFGGNPENVTLAGQSAGGTNTLAAMISPLSKDLFDRLIVLSGGMTLATTDQGNDRTIEAITKLVIQNGEADTPETAALWIKQHNNILEYLRSQPAEKLPGLYRKSSLSMDGTAYLFKDGVVVPEKGYNVIDSGNYNQVPVMLGSDKHEYALFSMTDDMRILGALMTGDLFKPSGKLLLDSYLKSSKYGNMIYSAYNAEKSARKLLTNDNQPPIYGFRFSWGEQQDVIKLPIKMLNLSARHGADMEFITGNFTDPFSMMLGKALHSDDNKIGREKLSKSMMNYIGEFMKNGSPNGLGNVYWSSFGKDNEQLLKLDADLNDKSIEMTDEVYDKKKVLSIMTDELSEKDLNNILDINFKGKNIWNNW